MKKEKLMAAHSNMAKKALEKAQHIEMELPEVEKIYKFNPNETFKEIVFSKKWLENKSSDYFDYRTQWNDVPRDKLETPFPIHLDIETTNICNLQCPMCPRTILLAEGSFSDLGFVTMEEYADIIDQGVKNNVKSIKLNYLGEPLAHPDVVWQIKYAKDKGILDVMLNTNASLLSKEMSENLLKAGLDNLFISFDAVDPEDYLVQRTGTTIGKVIDNIYNFSIIRKNIRPECQLRLSMVMYKDPKWMSQFEAMRIMWERHVDSLGYGYYVDRDIFSQKYYPLKDGFFCAQPFQRMFLKFNGNVTICCVDDKDETIVGNWKSQSLQNIWLGSTYKEIRKKHASGNYYDIEMCRKCYLPHSK